MFPLFGSYTTHTMILAVGPLEVRIARIERLLTYAKSLERPSESNLILQAMTQWGVTRRTAKEYAGIVIFQLKFQLKNQMYVKEA